MNSITLFKCLLVDHQSGKYFQWIIHREISFQISYKNCAYLHLICRVNLIVAIRVMLSIESNVVTQSWFISLTPLPVKIRIIFLQWFCIVSGITTVLPEWLKICSAENSLLRLPCFCSSRCHKLEQLIRFSHTNCSFHCDSMWGWSKSVLFFLHFDWPNTVHRALSSYMS